MTTSIAAEVAKRTLRASSRSLAKDFAAELRARVEHRASAWPSSRYQQDPVRFCREILGIEPTPAQVKILEAVRDSKRVAVKSGHNVGKSNSAVMVALWFYCSFDDARVVLSSTTARQVDQILWRELRMVHARAGRCVECKRASDEPRAPCAHSAPLDGELNDLARSGLKAQDFREIVGFTAREAEAVAGISGKNLLYILDEASGIPDAIYEAIEGNRAGGARVVLFSNPTRTTGEFFDAFNSKAEFYTTITVSSEETPNVLEGRDVIPGLANLEWIEEKKREWGEDSPLYKVRVKGEFAVREDGKILSLHLIAEAERRWTETVGHGPLYVGIDPAGPGGAGDESVFAARRGYRVLELRARRGLDEEGHIAELVTLLKVHLGPRDPNAIVLIDREGPIGARIYGALRAFAEHADPEFRRFDVVGVRSSDRALRDPKTFDRIRDELWGNLERWIRDGGAIPEDTKLAKELHEPEWVQQVTGRLKVTPKDELRKSLGRSPDRADAVALSVWERSARVATHDDERMAPSAQLRERMPSMDPYRAMSTWRTH